MKKGAKQISIFFAIGLIAPFLSYAATISVSPASQTATEAATVPMTITITPEGTQFYWYMFSPAYPGTDGGNNFNFNGTLQSFIGDTPVAPGVHDLLLIDSLQDSSGCSTSLADCLASPAYAGQHLTFLVTPDSTFPNFQIMGSVGTATDMLAAIGGGVNSTAGNLWLIVAASIGVTLAFYAIKNVAALFPKRYGKEHDPDIN